jgi:hypothetical protein
MDFKNIFSKKEEEEESCFPNLTFTERLIGFGICCVLGNPSITKATSSKSSPLERSSVSPPATPRNSPLFTHLEMSSH